MKSLTHDLTGPMLHDAQDIEPKKTKPQALLSIGAIMGAMPDCVLPALAEMKQRYPDLTIRITGDTSDAVMQMLASNQIELGVCRHIMCEQQTQFRFHPLGNESLVFVVSPGHPLSLKKHLSLEDLVDETWVMQAMPSPGRVLLERLFARNEMTRPHKIIECNSMHASLCILKHMPAVALLSEPVARDDLRRKSLLQLPLHLEGNLREYGIVVKRGATLSPMAKEFTQAIQQAAVGFFL